MRLTRKQQHARVQWNEFHEGPAENVEVRENQVTVIFNNGTGFGFSTDYGVVPKVGDRIRLYVNFTEIRGLDVNGEPVFFWTDEDMDERHRKWVAEQDAERERAWLRDKDKLLAAENELPDVFKQRINWFREHCPTDFNRNFLGYEILVCSEAVKIADALKTKERVQRWIEGGFKKRSGLYMSKQHSYNSVGMAARLAYNYLDDPRMVFFEHGALVPLVGCQKYGCAHPRPGIEEYAKEKGLELG